MARNIKITVHTARETPEPPSVVHLVLLFCGVCALLLPALDGLSYSVPRTILLSVTLCAFLWLMARVHWLLAVGCSILCAALWCAALTFWRDRFLVQVTAAARLLFSGAADPESVPFDFAASLFAVLLSLLFFSSELLIGSHVIPYSLLTVYFLLSPLLGLQPSVEALILALLFQFGYWAMNGSGMRQSRADFALPSRSRLTALTGAFMSGILVPVLLVSGLLAARNDGRLYEPAYAAEGFVRRTIDRMSGAASVPTAGGLLNRANLYPADVGQLILKTSRKPTETVYLRGFSGADYGYTGWEDADDAETRIFYDIAAEWQSGWDISARDLKNMASMMRAYFKRMYWTRNLMSRTREERRQQVISMTVQLDTQRYISDYTPYYSAWDSDLTVSYFSSEADLEPNAYFFEQCDLEMDWESGDADADRQLEQSYRAYIRNVYTRVPTDRAPRLAELCRENPLDSLDEITAFILYTLHSRADYSLTPGWTPFNRDYVDYFLFENGLGYCQHFASAATLMYRMYGVPARYATGYVARPDDFMNLRAIASSEYPAPRSEQWDGECFAVLTDADAHAWVEIFLPGYGWTPIEVTPAANGETVTPAYPGLNLDLFSERLAEWNLTFPAPAQRHESGRGAGRSLVRNLGDRDFTVARRTMLVCVCAAPFVTAAGLYWRRKRRLAMYAAADCRVSFGKLLSMLRLAGLLDGYDGQEADFPARLSAELPEVSETDAARLCRTAEIAAYGHAPISDEEHAFSRRLCRRTAYELYNRLNVWKRFLFRWWYGYL